MKKLLLLGFVIVVFISGFQYEAATQTKSQVVTQAAESHLNKTRFLAFNADQSPEKVTPADETELRAASAKAIKLIQHSQVVWSKKQTCTSCHHQLLPEMTLSMARERGIPFNETIARSSTVAAFDYLKDLDSAVQGYDYIDVFFDGWALTSAGAIGIKPSLSTAAFAQFIASRQLQNGSWPTIDARPPQGHSPFAATAVCAQAIQHYLPARLKGEQEARIRQAREWLLKSEPQTTEDRAFQLLGLLWTGADEDARQNRARQLLTQQREDGGWAQLPVLASDSYATGEVLFALHKGVGLQSSHPAYQRGLSFLLRSQQPDGSWRIKSRLHPPAPVSPRYVDTEFPEGHDQFVSIMGTTWAVNAFLQALPTQAGEKPKQNAPLDFAPVVQSDQLEWQRIALTGSAAELKKLLDGGMKPDAKTAAGTTALMLAVRDIKKVKLLLARGADVNARAASGVTPLMVAARQRGNTEVVRLLLEKGATTNAEKGAEVRNEATALFFAVMAGDVRTAGALLDAGARVGDRMKVLGQFVIGTLTFAALGGESGLVEFLISKGANANEVDDDGLSALAWATLTNHVETIQVLLTRGAQVNRVDNFGMTPVLYAASVDFGDTAVLEKLIAAGADLKAKNKQGQTALDLAKAYSHSRAASLLTSRIASR